MADEVKTTNGKMRPLTKKPSMMQESEDYMLPCFEVMMSDIPEADDWDVGEDYSVELVVTQKRVSDRDGEKWVEFKIKKIKAL